MSEERVLPGNRLGNIDEHIPGEGTYVRGQYIYASVLGFKQIKQNTNNNNSDNNNNNDNNKTIINVLKELEPSTVPELHSIVIGRVTRINPRLANVDILVVGNKSLKEPFNGIVRFDFDFDFQFYFIILFFLFYFIPFLFADYKT